MTIAPPLCCEHIVCAITLSSKLDYCNAMQDIGCPPYFTISSLILTLLVAGIPNILVYLGIPVTVIVEPVLTHHPLPGCQRHCTSLSIYSAVVDFQWLWSLHHGLLMSEIGHLLHTAGPRLCNIQVSSRFAETRFAETRFAEIRFAEIRV